MTIFNIDFRHYGSLLKENAGFQCSKLFYEVLQNHMTIEIKKVYNYNIKSYNTEFDKKPKNVIITNRTNSPQISINPKRIAMLAINKKTSIFIRTTII